MWSLWQNAQSQTSKKHFQMWSLWHNFYKLFSYISNSFFVWIILICSEAKMFDIYNNSLFIPIGRGNCNLNCSRLYECIIAGAIPVIVASNEESDYQFTFNYGKPIIIINNSWEDAVIKCKELLNKKDELQKIQDYNIEWWNNEIKFIQDKILSL